MADRRTQSYAAIPREPIEDDVRFRGWLLGVRADVQGTDPEDEPELPPSPTFWPRDEPKEPG